MRVVCVDGDERDCAAALALCEAHPAIDDAVGLRDARQALAWLKKESADLVLLDAELPDMSGLELARALREKYPRLALLFVTAHAQYALEAYAEHPQSYLLKPLTREALEREVNYFLLSRTQRDVAHIEVKTFGNFEITVDGSAVAFKRSRAKELLALLVDRQGAGIPRAQAFTEMWEDREYDRSAQKYFDNILASLRATLRAYRIGEILELRGGFMRIRPELIDCDRYRFTLGDAQAINEYQGVYMYGYSWANWNADFYG